MVLQEVGVCALSAVESIFGAVLFGFLPGDVGIGVYVQIGKSELGFKAKILVPGRYERERGCTGNFRGSAGFAGVDPMPDSDQSGGSCREDYVSKSRVSWVLRQELRPQEPNPYSLGTVRVSAMLNTKMRLLSPGDKSFKKPFDAGLLIPLCFNMDFVRSRVRFVVKPEALL